MKITPELISFLKQEDAFFIATHISPDGDGLGSALALSSALESMGKKTLVYDKDEVPELYLFLPGHERFVKAIPGAETPISNLILVDCNEPERAGLENFRITNSAVIDHHETLNSFGDIKWIEPHAAATGLMVYYLIKELGLKITKEIAANLYTAIAIDTGTFRYNNTTSEVLRASAELVEAGAEPANIAVALYETWSDRRFKLLIRTLATLEIKGDVALIHVTKEMFEATGSFPEDTESFAVFPRRIKHVNAVAFFMEMPDSRWKISLRSRGVYNVADIAQAFNGGGHRNAAGYKIIADLNTAKELLLKAFAAAKLSVTPLSPS